MEAKPYPDTGDAANDIQTQGHLAAQLSESLQEQMLFNLDFMDDLGWNSWLGEMPMFGVGT
jgi:hypothetical protein